MWCVVGRGRVRADINTPDGVFGGVIETVVAALIYHCVSGTMEQIEN